MVGYFLAVGKYTSTATLVEMADFQASVLCASCVCHLERQLETVHSGVSHRSGRSWYQFSPSLNTLVKECTDSRSAVSVRYFPPRGGASAILWLRREPST